MTQPYDRTPNESDPAWQAFCRYRDMGAGRSLAKVGQERGKSGVSLVERWSSQYSWVERVRAYDDHLEERDRETREAAHAKLIIDHRERAQKIGKQYSEISIILLQKALEGVKTLTPADLTVKNIASFIRAASLISQLSLNMEAEALGIAALLEDLNAHAEDEDAAEDT